MTDEKTPIDTDITLNHTYWCRNWKHPEKNFTRFDLMGEVHIEWYLPTEVVVHKPEIVSPSVARIYKTPLYLKRGKIIDYEELRKTDGFQGTYKEDPIYLVEIWEDAGDDGHTEYKHEGYAFIPKGHLPRLEHGMSYPSYRNSYELPDLTGEYYD